MKSSSSWSIGASKPSRLRQRNYRSLHRRRRLFETLEPRHLLAVAIDPGTLDASFGSAGQLTSDLGGFDRFGDMALTSDGSIIAAGLSDNRVVVAKYKPTNAAPSTPGQLDTNFAGDGVFENDLNSVLLPLNMNVQAVTGVAIDSDGKILVTGWGDLVVAPAANQIYSFVIRLNANGTPDIQFDGDGGLTFQFAGSGLGSHASDIAVDTRSGTTRILVGGTSFHATRQNNDFALKAFNSKGEADLALDVSIDFKGVPGELSPGSGSSEHLNRIIVQPDGSILMAGYIENPNFFTAGVAVARVKNGVLDPNFGTLGRTIISTVSGREPVYAANGITLQPDGEILLAVTGSEVTNFAALRLHGLDGTIDEGFTDLSGDILFASAQDVLVQPDGKIILAGFGRDPATFNNAFITMRKNADGSRDQTWGTQGVLATPVPASSASEQRFTSLLQPDGKILLGTDSASITSNDFTLVRYFGESGPLPLPTVTATSFDSLGVLPIGTTTITVTYNLPVISADNPANYSLRAAGANHLLEDADPVIHPTSIIYRSQEATLTFSTPLVEDVYRLTVLDAIANFDAAKLDGDADALAGGHYRKDFVVDGKSSIELLTPTTEATDRSGINSKHAFSDDGRFFVFSSTTSLAAGALAGIENVYVRDFELGTTTLVSANKAGLPADVGDFNARSYFPAISGNGKYVIFQSNAKNLPDNAAGTQQIFRKDISTGDSKGDVVLVSRTAAGIGDRDSLQADISNDGRYVTFVSSSTNFVPVPASFAFRVFFKDMQDPSGEIKRLMVDEESSLFPSVSGDGRYVVYQSSLGIAIHDRGETGTGGSITEIASGTDPSISSDGKYVVFAQQDTGGVFRKNIMLYDIATKVSRIVSTDAAGEVANFGGLVPSISHNGRYVSFASSATNLDPTDTNDRSDVYVKDTLSQGIARVSRTFNGKQSDGASLVSVLSADGRRLGFESFANNLVPNDRHRIGADIFVTPLPLIFNGPSGMKLDTSFGVDGSLKTPIESNSLLNQGGVVIQSDGKAIVAGSSANTGIVLARYNRDGVLDTSFGDVDPANTNQRIGTVQRVLMSSVSGIALQSDGKIVILGTTTEVVPKSFVARFTTDGVLDKTFNSAGAEPGIATLDTFLATSLAIQQSDRILVAGSKAGSTRSEFALAAFGNNGEADNKFGVKTLGFSDRDAKGLSIAVNPIDDSIVVAGEGYGESGTDPSNNTVFSADFALARFTADGTPISTFGDNGKVATPLSLSNERAYSVAFQADGKIVAVGSVELPGGSFAVARYNTDGTLDSTFNGTGMNLLAFKGFEGDAHGVTILPNGKIIVVGSAAKDPAVPNQLQFALAGFTTNGVLDTSFGTGGQWTEDFSGRNARGFGIATDQNGRTTIVGKINGTAADGPDAFGLIRLENLPGYAFDIDTTDHGYGQLRQGPQNAFDGVNRLVVGGTLYSASAVPTLDPNIQAAVTPTTEMGGLKVHREIYAPTGGRESFVRSIDVFENDTAKPITTSVSIVGNLGSDAATRMFATSDGDTDAEVSDLWIGTDDADPIGGTPSIIHYIHGPNGSKPTNVQVLEDNIIWTYQLTVADGQTVSLAHFTILNILQEEAIATATSFLTSDGRLGTQAVAGLSEPEIARINNFLNNSPPEFSSAPVLEGTQGAEYSYTITTVDPDVNDTRTITAVITASIPDPEKSSWLKLTDNKDGSASLTGTPSNAQTGSFDVVLTVTDASNASTTQAFTIVIPALPPTTSVTQSQTTLEDTALSIPGFGIQIAGSTTASPVTITFSASKGTIQVRGGIGNNTSTVTKSGGIALVQIDLLASGIIYTPDLDYNGPDTITVVTLDESNGESRTDKIEITVTPVNDASLANDTTVLGLENIRLQGTLTGFDVDGDLLTYTLLTGPDNSPVHGEVALDVTGGAAFNYTPNADFVGSDTFRFQVDDGSGATSQATVTVVVQATIAPIAGRVVFDADGNNKADPNEIGIANIEVTLSAADKNFIPLTQRTNEYGEFDFRGLLPRGDYLLTAAQPVFTTSTPDAAEDFQFAMAVTDVLVSRDFAEKEVVGAVTINAELARWASDLLVPGLIFAHSGSDADWWAFGDGWIGYKNLRMTIAADGSTITLFADRITKTDDVPVQQEINVIGNPLVVLKPFDDGQFVVNLRGSAEDFGLPKASLPGWAVMGSKADDVLTVDYSKGLFSLNGGARKRLNGIETLFFDGGTGNGKNTVAIIGMPTIDIFYKPDAGAPIIDVPRDACGNPVFDPRVNPGEGELTRLTAAGIGPGGGDDGSGLGGGGRSIGGGGALGGLVGLAAIGVLVAQADAFDAIITDTSSMNCPVVPQVGIAARTATATIPSVIDARNITPVDFSQFGSLNVQPTGIGSQILISDDFNTALTADQEASGNVPAWKISGTSGGFGFEQAHLYRSQSLVVDTSAVDGDDTITFDAGSTSLVEGLKIKTGMGSDTVKFDRAVRLADLQFEQIDLGEGDNTLAFTKSGNDLDLSNLPAGKLQGVHRIDFRGAGFNQLKLSVAGVMAMTGSAHELELNYDHDDVVQFGDGWKIAEPVFVDGLFRSVIESENKTAKIVVANDRPYQNPLIKTDVNGDQLTTMGDAKAIIDILYRARTREQGEEAPPVPGNTHLYYDPSGDNFFSALDALIVVNSLYRQPKTSTVRVQAAAESTATPIQIPLVTTTNTNHTIELDLPLASPEQTLMTQKKVQADFVVPDTQLVDQAFMQWFQEETAVDDSLALELQALTTSF